MMRAITGLAKLLQFALLHGFDRLEFNIDDVKACRCGFGENLDLSRDIARKLAAIRCPATGGDAGRRSVVSEEMLKLRQRKEWLVEIVEPELEESRLFDDSVRFFKHFGSRGADDGNTDLTDTGSEVLWGYARHIHCHIYNRGILQTPTGGCKFLLKPKGVRPEIPDLRCNLHHFRC